MKKILFALLVCVATFFYACGPSADDKAKEEKARQDSVNAVNAADSMMRAQQQAMDSTNKMARDTMKK